MACTDILEGKPNSCVNAINIDPKERRKSTLYFLRHFMKMNIESVCRYILHGTPEFYEM